MLKHFTLLFLFTLFGSLSLSALAQEGQAVRRIGIIGVTTSHVQAFTDLINSPDQVEPISRYRVTAAYPGGMPDNPSSWDRLPGYLDYIKKCNIDIYPTIESMLPNIDCVMLLSVDGRPHLEQALPVIDAGKPLFIDKPAAGSLADLMEIFQRAKEKNCPVFTSSSLRYGNSIERIINDTENKIMGADTFSPCYPNNKHPFFYWYGIHGIEMLFALMGRDCVSVSATTSPNGDLVTGLWNDGRIGTFRGLRKGVTGYGATVFTEKTVINDLKYDGYASLAKEICLFFDTGKAPVDSTETIALFAFMDAAETSMNESSRSVSIAETIEKSRNEQSVRVDLIVPASFTGEENQTLLLDNAKIELAALREEIQQHRNNNADTVVKIILRIEAGVPFEKIQMVLDHLGDAYLANFLYDYESLLGN